MNEELPKLIDEANAIADDAQKSFGQLNAQQLNWRPSANQWSVAQCLEHLIVINSTYFPILEGIERDRYKPSIQQRLPLLPRFFAWMVLKAVSPETKSKFKTAGHVAPSSSTIADDILAKFKAHQQELIRHMKERAEAGRVSVRNVRRHTKDELEHLERDGELSEDDLKRVEKELQKLTDRFTHEIDELSGFQRAPAALHRHHYCERPA